MFFLNKQIQEQNVWLFYLCSYKYEILHAVGVAQRNFVHPLC